MTIKQLKNIIADLPDDMEVKLVSAYHGHILPAYVKTVQAFGERYIVFDIEKMK